MQAGIDVEGGELEGPELIAVIQEVLANFDPEAPITEEDAMFSAQQVKMKK